MACKIEIKKAVEATINKYLPYRESVFGKEAAIKISKSINKVWDTEIAKPVQYSSIGGYKISLKNVDKAVEKEYSLQLEAEKSFIRDINFYGGDRALMEQEEGPENLMLQLSGSNMSAASPELIKLIKDLLNRSGIDFNEVKNIIINGKKLDANGVANVTKAWIEVVEGKTAYTLPEEAMHFVVELIEKYNKPLFNKMLKEVNSYAILDAVFKNYANNPLYQTKEGKPNILKLKKEAMGQILAELTVKNYDGRLDRPENLKARSWLDAIILWLKNLFKQSGFNQVSLDIISGKDFGEAKGILDHTDEYYISNTRRDSVYNSILQAAKNIKPAGHPDNADPDHYYEGTRQIRRRVSDLIYNWYDQKFRDKKLTNTEFTNSVNEMKAEKGTLGHQDQEHFFDLFIDENGFIRETPLKDTRTTLLMGVSDAESYNILKENFRQRIHSYGKNARFLKEQIIFDKARDIAGTVDLIVIEEDGTVNLLDWKFMDLNIDKWDDVPWYKVNAWNQQMGHYKRIISQMHDIKSHEFGHARMIPIKTFYSYGNAKENEKPVLLSIKIGDVDVKAITDDYLLPVGLETESTYNKEIDALIKKLNKIYVKMGDTKVLPDQKAEKSEQLNALYKAIRKLHIQRDIVPLINQAKILNVQINRIKQRFEETFVQKEDDGKLKKTKKGEYITIDPNKLSEEEISSFTKSLADGMNYIEVYTELEHDLESLIDENLEGGKELKEALKSVSGNARTSLRTLKSIDTVFTNDIIAGSVDIKDAFKPEKVIKGISRMFSSTATLQIKTIQTLYKKADKQFAFAAFDTRTELNKLERIKNEYTIWANGKGLPKNKLFNILMKEKKNELIDQFERKFYDQIKIKQQEKDYTWLRDNLDADAYKQHLEDKLETEINRIQSKVRVDTVEKNEQAEAMEISQAKSLYSIEEPTSLGWLLQEARGFPRKDKWESTEWKELNKPENKPALDFYNYIRERNEYYASIGYINSYDARKFLPWVRKGFAEKMIFGGKTTLGEQFLRNITLDEKETEFGQIDPLTGKPVDTVPILLTTELDVDYSTDLFKTIALYNEFAIKFNYIKQIEDQASALLRLERNKGSLATSYFGITKYENEEPVPVGDNTANTKLLDAMVKGIIYQQRYIESEMFDTILGKIGPLMRKINKKLGYELLPEQYEGRVFSVNKSITQINNQYQLITLGWNPLSSLSNLFGGKTQGFINSGRYFTKNEYISTELWLLANRMGNSDKKFNFAALEYFMPFTDNFNREKANKLSISKLTAESYQDYLMFLMRNSDRAVQTTFFYAFFKNAVVTDGKVVNAREHVRNTYPEFNNEKGNRMYEGSKEEREQRKQKFEEEVKKLLEEKALTKIGKLNDKGEFEIPGVERKDKSVIDLRRKIQAFTNDALGNATEANRRLINMSVYGNSAMVFKNWLPRLVDVRVGDLKYNAGSDAYEWGRTRMIFKVIAEDVLKSLSTLTNMLRGTEKGVERLEKFYADKRKEYEKETGKTLDMTPDEFMDLVRRNIENQLYDTIFYITLFSLTAGLKALAPDDEESEAVKNQWRFLVRASDKLTDELGYFYNPTNIFQLISRGVFPSTNLITTYSKVLTNFMAEMYGLVLKDDELVDDTQVIKYIMKSFPILNQSTAMLPMFAPELAKDLGLRTRSNYGIR